jgi:hypothetical protein
LDAEEENKKVQAQMLTPPPAPPTDEEYKATQKKLDDWEKKKKDDKQWTKEHGLRSKLVTMEHSMGDKIKSKITGAKQVGHNIANELEREKKEISIRMEKINKRL